MSETSSSLSLPCTKLVKRSTLIVEKYREDIASVSTRNSRGRRGTEVSVKYVFIRVESLTGLAEASSTCRVKFLLNNVLHLLKKAFYCMGLNPSWAGNFSSVITTESFKD